MNTLTLLTTAHIQSFIFQRSNRLRENIGASWLVQNIFNDFNEPPNPCKRIFIGGGQAALRFEGQGSAEQAKQAVQRWSRQALDTTPGLRLLAVHLPYESGQLQAAFVRAQQEHLLERSQHDLPHGCQLGALPVARICPSTALAANCFHEEQDDENTERWLNVEAARKRDAEKSARDGNELERRYKFPRNLDKMGLRMGDSFIALIHADGDGIGEELRQVIHDSYQSDDEFADSLAAFSSAIADLNRSTREQLYSDLAETHKSIRKHELVDDSDFFPFRPLIGAGDDVTFISSAKLGLPLACHYLQIFSERSRKAVKNYRSRRSELSASAGVLLMPRKFPLARGYHLVEEVASSAKRARRKHDSQDPWIDFHILHESIAGSLETIRSHYWLGNEHNLLKRPYSVADFQTGFHELWRHLYEKWPHSSAKALLESLTRGPVFAGESLDYFRARHLSFPEKLQVPPNGWQGESTPLFDPLEFLDQYVPINWKTFQVELPLRADRRRRSPQSEDRSLVNV